MEIISYLTYVLRETSEDEVKKILRSCIIVHFKLCITGHIETGTCCTNI